MDKLGPQNRSPEYAVVDATAVIVERLQEEMQIARPIITPENFSDFASGKIESGSFSVAPKTPQEHELSLRVLQTACLRASDQDDPLFVEHAARRHPKTYASVLEDFIQLTGGGR